MVTDTPAGTALVTGGARRLGRAIVEDLAAHGWAVAIHCRNSRAEADALAAEISGRGGRAAVVVADFADPHAAAPVIDEAAAALGPLTLLVNNASLFERDGVGTIEVERWNRQLAVNVTAPAMLSQAFAAQVPAGVEGNIINMLDQRVWRPTPHYQSYQVSKAALYKMTETMAQALAPHIRVNAIAPGPTMPSSKQSEARFQRMTDAILLGRAPALTDFGRTVRYIVEMRSMTGHVIALDSGQRLGWRTPDLAELDD